MGSLLMLATYTRWAPGRQDTFLVAHASGQLYTYQVCIHLLDSQINQMMFLQAELECGNLPPVYQQQKQGEPKFHTSGIK